MAQTQTTTDEIEVVKRTAGIQRIDDVHGPGSARAFDAKVDLYDSGGVFAGVPGIRRNFALIEIVDDMADEIRGQLPDVDGTPVMMIGDNFGKNYYNSDISRTVPVDLLEAMRDRDMVLVRNVDGGWASWGGRPEWSDTYVDFSDAEVVDMHTEIEQRRDNNE